MKKILFGLILSSFVLSANAAQIPSGINAYKIGYNNGYSVGYNSGHRDGKRSAYNHVARTTFFVFSAVVVGAIIYTAGKESRWTARDGKVGYRF